MKILYLNFVLILFFIISCGEKKQTESKTDALLDKVMAVHDEVMPSMMDISKLKKEVNTKIEELAAADEAENAEKIDELKKVFQELESSQQGMRNWMKEFDRDFEGKVEEEVLKYLNDQMTRIEKVSSSMKSAISKAEELLSK